MRSAELSMKKFYNLGARFLDDAVNSKHKHDKCTNLTF